MSARVVIAAPGSGSGKTMVATGLMAALRARGHSVAPGKVGPDYIDPGYHALAAGRPGRNLDPVLVDEATVPSLLRAGAAGSDIAVLEGVMGLYDGKVGGSAGFGSTAHVAELVDAPVLLVVDARGQGRSLAALLHGFRSYRPGVRISGVILNNVGSRRHVEVLTEAADEVGLPVLGALPRDADVTVPSRHLGLLTAAEHGVRARRAVQAMAELIAAHIDLDAVVRTAREAPPLSASAWSPDVRPVQGSPVIAIAGGPAFTFGYAEHVELLAAAGAEVAHVDPLRDKNLPAGTAGLVLPGGFPQLHAGALSENAALRAEVAAFAAGGGPVHAECAGLLYLAEELDGTPMCGVLPAKARFTEQLTLGYRDAVALTDSALFRAGQRVCGHEFHRTALEPDAGQAQAWGFPGNRLEGFVTRGVHASYLHTHPAGNPEAVARFVTAAQQAEQRFRADRPTGRARSGDRERYHRAGGAVMTEEHYLAGLDLRDRRVVLVGGGGVAQRRLPRLIAAGARIELVSPEVTTAVAGMIEAGELRWTERRYTEEDLDGAWYAIAASSDAEVNARVVADAERRRIFCVRSDRAVAGTAVTPAIGEYDGMVLGVLAGGAHRRSATLRDVLLEALHTGALAEYREAAADRSPGVVLVGAGPGDPDLITVAGRRELAAADLVVADRLAPRRLLDELAPQVEVVDAAKIPYGRAATQEAINKALIDGARAGKRVVRLKGGDSFVFGRGYEEVLACTEAGVAVTVVPGVTSAFAAPACAGIPITHRGVTHEVTVVSGHFEPDDERSLVDWPSVARLRGTLVLMMAMQRLDRFAAVLRQNGKPGDTPVAVIADGSTPNQRVLQSTLDRAAEDVAAQDFRPPAIVVIGPVAGSPGADGELRAAE